ncbi:MAG: dipicolinate synthase subunit B [Clostridia bacterium]|nr:dipicolinate synthase subunit B [Clostridia bacterium]
MELTNIRIGLGITGSFCTFSKLFSVIETLKNEGATVLPIMSQNAYTTDTRFGNINEIKEKIENLTNNKIIATIPEAEPIGPKNLIDIMFIYPCTGNTIAKLANAITDTPVLMATKSHLRNQKPVLIGISTNDGLGANAKNIGNLLNTKNIFFVPFGQDDYIKKPNSLVCDNEKITTAIKNALEFRQVQPILTGD